MNKQFKYSIEICEGKSTGINYESKREAKADAKKLSALMTHGVKVVDDRLDTVAEYLDGRVWTDQKTHKGQAI